MSLSFSVLPFEYFSIPISRRKDERRLILLLNTFGPSSASSNSKTQIQILCRTPRPALKIIKNTFRVLDTIKRGHLQYSSINNRDLSSTLKKAVIIKEETHNRSV